MLTGRELVGLINLRKWLEADDYGSVLEALPFLLKTLEHKEDLLKFIDRTLKSVILSDDKLRDFLRKEVSVDG